VQAEQQRLQHMQQQQHLHLQHLQQQYYQRWYLQAQHQVSQLSPSPLLCSAYHAGTDHHNLLACMLVEAVVPKPAC